MEVAVLAGLVGIGYLFNSKNKDNNPINNSVQKEVSTPNGENVYHSEFYNEADKVIRTLASNNFEEYRCNREKIVIGVNMFHLFKLINSIDNDDTLTIYIENSHYSDGVVDYLGLKFENVGKCWQILENV